MFSANQIVGLDSEHVQSDGNFVNRGLPVLDLSRGCDILVLTKRSVASEDENDANSQRKPLPTSPAKL